MTHAAGGLAFAIVNYKSPEITPICLELIKDYAQKHGAEVWVVDNASADASTDYLRATPWIHLIERQPEPGEAGFQAHGRALDMVLARTSARHLFLMHTDTFIYDTRILDIMIEKMQANPKVAVVGCMEQIYRGQLRTAWRHTSRYVKHHYRQLKTRFGLATRPPRRYMESHLKSFCALWNTEILKSNTLTFMEGNVIPGYGTQDALRAKGYLEVHVPAREMFRYLDHIEAGTVAAVGGYGKLHRRHLHYKKMLRKATKGSSDTPD